MKAHPLDLLLAVSNYSRAVTTVVEQFAAPGLTRQQYQALIQLLETDLAGLAAIILLDVKRADLPSEDWSRSRFIALRGFSEGDAS
ncbi:hypothetical protein [Bosea vaviloviae]|uniref:Uncharacterized protein n=1 Tax=Bosea vaviloviae TaxID=1526658 RepID=A0A0N1F4N2_9HYPH|nr:hypothetical protein [Bosea vaviloviae]KPH80552.1 hypothetical protein AE618_12320 [Bosea vaviloviae]